jgi:golgin subfamily B member 1
LYLSHDLPDMEKIESIYVFIWQWINQSPKSQEHFDDITNPINVRNVVLNEIWGLLQRDQFEELFKEIDHNVVRKCWNSLVSAGWVDKDGKMLVHRLNVTENNLKKVLSEEINDGLLKKILFFFCQQKSRFEMIRIPISFENFVLLHLDRWITSALRALMMENERQYIVDAVVSPLSRHADPSPLILDLQTGSDLPNSQWDESLHQFLQLKHGCKLSLQSLKSVFISNVSFLKLYENLYGMSGTLGSPQEQEGFKKIHNVDFLKVPTFKPKLFSEIEPISGDNQEELFAKICSQTKEIAKSRAVLVICETVKDVNEYFDELASDKSMNVIALRREADALNSNLGEQKVGQIIIATNLAGRGMDFKLSNEVKAAGGLHVIVTELPSNIRIEEQALGRAARSGDQGSGQVCINLEGSKSSIFEMKQERNKREIKRLEKVEQYYKNFITIEEKFFEKFNTQYSHITESSEELKHFKKSFLNNWSFWLDENGAKIENKIESKTKRQNQNELMESLDKFMEINDHNNIDWQSSSIHKTSKINYAIHDSEKPNLKILSQVASVDPEHNVIARYYKFFAQNKNTTRTTNYAYDKVYQTFSELKNIVKNLETQKDQRFLQTEMLKPFVEKSKNKLMQLKGLSDQEINFDQLDNVVIDSINNILGQPIYPETFDSVLLGKQNLCQELYDELLRLGVLNPPKMSQNISAEKCEEIAKRSMTSPLKLIAFVSNYFGQNINIKNFGDQIKQNISVPSREDFWEILKSQKILNSEKDFFIFNKIKLLEVDPSLAEYLESESMKDSQVKLQSSELFLYDIKEANDDTVQLTFNAKSLQNIFDSVKFENLKTSGCLSVNKSGTFNANKVESCKFKKFDLLTLDDFEIVKIHKSAAEDILTSLLKSNVLKKLANFQYKLKKPIKDFDWINLEQNSVYLTAVQDLLKHCFPYQLALQKLQSDVKDRSTDVIIHLPSNTHLNILSDFVHFIEPATVDWTKSRGVKNMLNFSNIVSSSNIKSLQNASVVKNSSSDLESFLLDRKNIKKVIKRNISLELEICDFDIKSPNSETSEFRNIESTVKLKLQNIKILSDKSEEVAEVLESLVSTWFNKSLEEPKFVLKPIDDFVPELLYSEELKVYKNSGLTMVFAVVEGKKPKKMSIFSFIAVIFIGLAQIFIGCLITILSLGSMTHVGNALISEGIGDLVYAAISYASGNFSWAEYGKYKAISLAISVVTCGVGAYLSRAKHAVGFGFKFAGNSLSVSGKEIAKMSGMELIKAVGVKPILKELAKSVMKNIVKAGVMAGISYGVDKVLEKYLEGLINQLASLFIVNIDDELNKSGIETVLMSLYNILGKDKLIAELTSVVNKNIEDKKEYKQKRIQAMDIIDRLIQTIGQNLSQGIGNKIKTGLVLLSVSNKAVVLAELVTYVRSIINQIKSDLEKIKNKNRNQKPKNEQTTWDKLQPKVTEVIKPPIEEDVASIINQQLVTPLLTLLGNKLAASAAQAGKIVYHQTVRTVHNFEYRKYSKTLKQLNNAGEKLNVKQITSKEKHEKKLMSLMKKTKDPKLMAVLVRENTQMNMIGVEAAALVIPDFLLSQGYNVDKFQLKINQDNGDVYVFGKPGGIQIELDLVDNHFVNTSKGIKGNDCLFDALKDQIPQLKSITPNEFRNKLANRIMNDPAVMKNVEIGWHNNTMDRNAYGGFVKTNDPDAKKFLQGRNKHVTVGLYSQLIRTTQFGGTGRLPTPLEINHCPPKSSIPRQGDPQGRNLLAHVMLRSDHRRLQSTINPVYREKLTNLVSQGNWFAALKIEFKDILNVAKKSRAKTDYRTSLSQLAKEHQKAGNINAKQYKSLKTTYKLPSSYIDDQNKRISI